MTLALPGVAYINPRPRVSSALSVRVRLPSRRPNAPSAKTFDSGEDGVGGFGPDERLGLIVGLGEVSIDDGLQIGDRFEDATFEPSARQLCEEALDRIRPRTRGWGEMKGEARVAGEPVAHLGVLVRSLIIEDDVDRLVGGHGALDGVEKSARAPGAGAPACSGLVSAQC